MSAKKISGYTIFLKEVLGKGAYGSVYKGEQDGTKIQCAIKMLSKKNIDQDQYLKAALFSQIQVLKSVKSQNIVGFFDVMQSSTNYYIVQQLCNGDLQGLMKQNGGKLSQDKSIRILREICNGFLALVREGFVHRDLKPANILLANGVVKIGDFGFAKKNPNKRVKTQTSVGTPLYMSAQILKGEPYTSKCDIWALGFIFYEMLHGNTPWTANTQFELIKNIQNKPLMINPKLSVNTIDFLKKCLQAKQQDRYSWDDLFMHPIFEGYFNKYAQGNKIFENKMKKIMNDLRFTINSQNIDLIQLFQRLGFKNDLKFKDLQTLLKVVNPQIKNDQQVYIFQKLDRDNSGSISLKQLQNQLQNNHISLRSRYQSRIPNFQARTMSINSGEQNFDNKISENSLPTQLQKKISGSFKRLYKTLNTKNLTLYKTFLAYDTDKSGKLTIDQFGKIIKRLDSSFTEEQVSAVFDFIDVDKSKTIEFDELNSYYSKVNGLPQGIDLPKQYKGSNK